MKTTVEKKSQGITKMTISFLLITFGLTWGLASLAMGFPKEIESIFGEFNNRNLLFIIAVYSPGIAGILLVLLNYGIQGFIGYLKRFLKIKTSIIWWLFIIFGVPIVMYVGAIFKGTEITIFPFENAGTAIIALLLALLLGPIEEFGWRGFLLPVLNKKFNSLISGLVIGLIWMIWHLPAFFLGGTPQSAWAFFPFMIGGISISVIMAILFNDSQGSLLLPYLLHFQLNNPIWPDAQPWDNYLIGAVALIIIIFKRKQILNKEYGYCEVIK